MKLASIFGRGEEFPGANHTNDQPAQKNSIILTVDLVEIARPVAAIFPYLELLPPRPDTFGVMARYALT